MQLFRSRKSTEDEHAQSQPINSDVHDEKPQLEDDKVDTSSVNFQFLNTNGESFGDAVHEQSANVSTLKSIFKQYVVRPCKAVLRNAELLIWVVLFIFVVFVVIRHRSPPTQKWNKIVHKGLDHETEVRREALGLRPLDRRSMDSNSGLGGEGKQHDDLNWHADKDFLDQHDPTGNSGDTAAWESQQHVDLDHVPIPDWKQPPPPNYGEGEEDEFGAYDKQFRAQQQRGQQDVPFGGTNEDADAEEKRLGLSDNDQYPYSQWTEPPRRRLAPPPPLSLNDIKKHIRRLEMNEEFSLVKLRLKELEELKKQRQRLMDEYDFADEQDAFRDREREWQRVKWNEQEKKFHRWLQRARMQHDADDNGGHDASRSGHHISGADQSITPESCPGMFPEHPFVPYAQHSRTISESAYAYVTYVSSSEFVPAAATLLHSIAVSGSQYARAVVITEDISASDRETLSLLAQIIVIEKIPSPRFIDNPRYRETFTKLRVWELAMYTRILYIDTDVVVTKNMDDLFDIKEWAVPMDAEQHRYSTGMMVCDPSLKTFDQMMKELQTTTTSMELPDLLFLKAYFDNPARGAKINIIPRWYQVYQEEFGSQYSTYLTNRKQKLTIFDTRIHGIHYPGAGKPWGNYATKMAKYQPHFCHWRDADVFQYEPQFHWYVHHEMMLRSLTKAKSSSLFEYESAGSVIILKKWVEERKKKDEEDRSWNSHNSWSWNAGPSYGKSSYGKSNNDYSSNGKQPSSFNSNTYNQQPQQAQQQQQHVSLGNSFTWAFRDNRWVKVPAAGEGNGGSPSTGGRAPHQPFVVTDPSQLWLPKAGSCRFVVTEELPRVLSTQQQHEVVHGVAGSSVLLNNATSTFNRSPTLLAKSNKKATTAVPASLEDVGDSRGIQDDADLTPETTTTKPKFQQANFWGKQKATTAPQQADASGDDPLLDGVAFDPSAIEDTSSSSSSSDFQRGTALVDDASNDHASENQAQSGDQPADERESVLTAAPLKRKSAVKSRRGTPLVDDAGSEQGGNDQSSDQAANEEGLLTTAVPRIPKTNRSAQKKKKTPRPTTKKPITIDPKEDALRREKEKEVRRQQQQPAGKAYQQSYRRGFNPYSKLEEDTTAQRRLQQLDEDTVEELATTQPVTRRRRIVKQTPEPETILESVDDETATPHVAVRRNKATTLSPSPMDALLSQRSTSKPPASLSKRSHRVEQRMRAVSTDPPTEEDTLTTVQPAKKRRVKRIHPVNDANSEGMAPTMVEHSELITPHTSSPVLRAASPRKTLAPSVNADEMDVEGELHNPPPKRKTLAPSVNVDEVDAEAELHNPPPKRKTLAPSVNVDEVDAEAELHNPPPKRKTLAPSVNVDEVDAEAELHNPPPKRKTLAPSVNVDEVDAEAELHNPPPKRKTLAPSVNADEMDVEAELHNPPPKRKTLAPSVNADEMDVEAELHNPPPKRRLQRGAVSNEVVEDAPVVLTHPPVRAETSKQKKSTPTVTTAAPRGKEPSAQLRYLEGESSSGSASSAASGSANDADAHFMALLNALVDEESKHSRRAEKNTHTLTKPLAEDLEPLLTSTAKRSEAEMVPGATIDFSLVPPIVVSLAQNWTASPSDERYEWVVSWCTPSKLRPKQTTACGKPAHVGQYSLGFCRTNFDESFEVIPLYATASDAATTASTSGRSSAAVRTPPFGSDKGRGHVEAAPNPSTVAPTSWNATSSGDRDFIEPFPRDALYQHNEVGVAGVIFRSKVTLNAPLRAKWFEVAVRCDPHMPVHTAALDETPEVSVPNSKSLPSTTTQKPSSRFFSSATTASPTTRAPQHQQVDIQNVHPPHDRRYRLRLRSRCACLGGCDSTVNSTMLNATLTAAHLTQTANKTGVMATSTPSASPLTTTSKVQGRYSYYAAPTTTKAPIPLRRKASLFSNDASSMSSGDEDASDEASTKAPTRNNSKVSQPTNLTVGQKRYVLRTFDVWKRATLAPFGGLTAEETCRAFGRNVESCLESKSPLCDYNDVLNRCDVPKGRWLQQYDRVERRYCNCSHIGGDADKQRSSVEECIAEAELAGANVVNYVGSAPPTTAAPKAEEDTDADTEAPAHGRVTANRPTPGSGSRVDPKKTSFGCFYKKCSLAMVWSGKVDTAEYEPSGPTDGLTGFDIHVLNLHAV
ncbi:Hypothetical protein, putative [Bodo saltans]|uniref:Transmembrane protein n=1 Tax=Bodo saltans TaxID=75058 RepID=A0A0S4IRK9_BODSA|nr:Hypothetical protein, putative [Bodo saltans]|eukprot:CUF34928.1 Hypothetical protein, putative [Bodo saltans]